MNKPKNWLDVENANLKQFVGGLLQTELIPSFVQTTKYGTISINRFGMRDQDYEALPAPGTHRTAVLGASAIMGWGVGDGETFEALIEGRMNEEWSGGAFARYELLNMAVPGYRPPQLLGMADKAFEFKPDVLFYFAAGREVTRCTAGVAALIAKGVDIPYEGLRDIVAKAGVTEGLDEVRIRQRLTPYGPELLAYVYRRIVEQSRARGIRPVWIFLPQVREGSWQEETPETVAIAESAGFLLINLDDVYEGRKVDEVRLAPWDDHPNALGHRLIAERLFAAIEARRGEIFQSARH